MDGNLRINEEERKRLTTGREVERPKYTFFILDKSVQYSSANRKELLGDIERIYEEFESSYPQGDFEDWKQYYFEKHNGEKRLDEAAETAYGKFLTIREAIKQLNKEDIRDFIEGFALYGTYESRNPHEAVKEKLKEEEETCREIEDYENAPEDADITYGEDYYLNIQKGERTDEDRRNGESNLLPIYYNEEDSGITVDTRSLNKSLADY